MLTCRICLHTFQTLRFPSERLAVCGRCVNTLNATREVAQMAEQRISDMLRRGIERRAIAEQDSDEPWRVERAMNTLDHLDAACQQALPGWLNRLLADSRNTQADFKRLRAYRRGLLHYDRPRGWGYPSNWTEVAARIRRLDSYRCVGCGAVDCILDVHHIVYVSNFGTHQQANLVTLCRLCHETEHEREFDFGEKGEADGREPPNPATPEPSRLA